MITKITASPAKHYLRDHDHLGRSRPAGRSCYLTVLLAAGILHERVRPLQAIGAMIALGGVAILGMA